MIDAEGTARAFKTAWFTKAARKARIEVNELCDAIEEVRKGQANIENDDLEDFRTLAKKYAALSEKQIAQLLEDKDLMEICNGAEKQV